MGIYGQPVPVWVTPEAEVPVYGTDTWVQWLERNPGLAQLVALRTRPVRAHGVATALVVEVRSAAWALVAGSLLDHYRTAMGGPAGPARLYALAGHPVLAIGGLHVAVGDPPAGATTWDPATGWADGEGNKL